MGSLPGTIVAALLVGVSEALLATYISPTWAKFAFFILLIAVLVVRPQGLFGTVERGRCEGAHRSGVAATVVVLGALVAFPFVFRANWVVNIAVFTMMFAGLATAWNLLGGFSGYLSLGQRGVLRGGRLRDATGSP